MATNLHPSNENATEEDYIDMDMSFFCSPPHSREFEFHVSSNQPQREETTPSPADELFYKGKLLPLHLPPRLHMVESLTVRVNDGTNTVSGELNAEVLYLEESNKKKKKKWSKKLDLMRKSSMGLKYIKSLFTKSEEKSPKTITLVRSMERERMVEEEECNHRKSFSGAINWLSLTKSSPCSSSSSSFSSVSSGPLVLKRSSSVNSDMESPIEGAIAHCKKSQQSARKSVSSTVTDSKIVAACEIKERPEHCRG